MAESDGEEIEMERGQAKGARGRVAKGAKDTVCGSSLKWLKPQLAQASSGSNLKWLKPQWLK